MTGSVARRMWMGALCALLAGCSASGSGSGSQSSPAAPPGSGAPATSGSVPTGTAARATPPSRSEGCDAVASEAEILGKHTDQMLTSSGVVRTFKQWLPSTYRRGTPIPLVIDLHGYTEGSAVHTLMSNLGAYGETHGFATVTPQGTGKIPFWNAVPVAGSADDIGFVADLIDDLSRHLCLDLTRVYATGLSNGAFMSSLIACRLADKVAAIAPIAGLMLPPDCTPSRAVPILAIHGTADPLVGYSTDGYTPAAEKLVMDEDSRPALGHLPFRNIPDTLAAWAKLEGCAAEPATEPVTASVDLIRYDGCRDGSVVSLLVVRGGGHTWPGSAVSSVAGDILGPTTMEIDANERMWDFFSRHSLGA